MTGQSSPTERPSADEQPSANGQLSRRRLLALATAAASAGTLSGCGYRPGGGDIQWEDGTGTGPYRPDDLLASEETAFTVNRSVRGFDFESEEWGESAEIAAYDAASGGPIWEETTPPSGRPATSGGRLYVGHEDDGIVALESGEVRWEADVGEFPRTVAAGGERVYGLTEAGDLLAFAADGGDRLWETAASANDRTTLGATGDGVVVHYYDEPNIPVVAALGGDGERRWTVDVAADPDGRPVVDSETGTVFVPGDRTLLALSLADGSERWSQSVTGLRDPLAVADGRLYYVAGDVLYARNARDGETLWHFQPTDRYGSESPPAVADGQVYVADRDAVYAIAAEDGTVDWQVESGSVSGAPRVAGETVVVSTSEGYVRGHYRG